MTKQEAIDLEKQCEVWLADNLNKKSLISTDNLLTIGLALTGKLRIVLGNCAILLNKDLETINWIQFTGFYSDLEDIKNTIILTIREHKNDYERLIWSYENRKELTND